MTRRWQKTGEPFAHVLGVLALGFGSLAGCNGSGARLPEAATFESVCVSAGICDEARAPPEIVDVVCDGSVGTTCTRENVRATIEVVARFLGPRSGSRLRLWAMGSSVAETRIVGEVTAPALTERTRTRRTQLDRFVTRTVTTLALAIEPTLARAGVHRSPIAESLTKIALADGYGLPRRIIVVSHAREFSSLRDFACGKLPTETEFARALRKRGLLHPGSLAHVQTVFAFVTSTSVGALRCSVHMDRELRIRELWRTAITRAGGSEVRFDSGVPVLVGERPSPSPNPTTDRRHAP